MTLCISGCGCPDWTSPPDIEGDWHQHEGCRVYHRGKVCPNLSKGDPTMAKESAEEALGFRVSRVTVKETEDGGKSGDATVIGVGFTRASELIENIGEGVELRAGDNRQRAVLRSITFKAGKDGKPGTTTLKVTGGAELDDHIGRAVKVRALQMDLTNAR